MSTNYFHPLLRLPSIQGALLQGFRGNCNPRSKDNNDVPLTNLRGADAAARYGHGRKLLNQSIIVSDYLATLPPIWFANYAGSYSQNARMACTGFSGVTEEENLSMKVAMKGYRWGKTGNS